MPAEKKRSTVKQKEDCASQDDEKDTPPETEAQSGTLKPSKLKIGEDSDNLKQRGDWFQKRSGRK